MIEVEGLTVRFGGVTPIDDMTVTFPGGTCGLIGPNGAGKTTFFNVLSGFVKPAAGSIRAFGEDIFKLADFRRARWGLRRSFQQEQAITSLSVFDNVAMVHEHSGQARASRRQDVLDALAFVGLEVSPKEKAGVLGARDRGCSRSPERRSESLASCSSTSRLLASPTRRRCTWAR